jgi:hypothetical protein
LWNRSLFCAATTHLTTAAAVVLHDARAGSQSALRRNLSQHQEQAAKECQRNLHSLLITRPETFCRTFFGIQSSVFASGISLTDLNDELVRILVEIFFAALAAQFHFLTLIGEHIRSAHVAAEFFAGHGTGRQLVRRGFGVISAQGEVRSNDNSGDDEQFLHFMFGLIVKCSFELLSYPDGGKIPQTIFSHFQNDRFEDSHFWKIYKRPIKYLPRIAD